VTSSLHIRGPIELRRYAGVISDVVGIACGGKPEMSLSRERRYYREKDVRLIIQKEREEQSSRQRCTLIGCTLPERSRFNLSGKKEEF
jgi:hypothetical protein